MQDHSHAVPIEEQRRPTRVLFAAAVLTFSFMLVEVVVGWWSGSLALLADAGHMLGDGGSLLLALFAAQIATRPEDSTKTFGYQRAEVLGAFVNGLILAGISLWVAFKALARISAGVPEIHGMGMLLTALLGLVVNLVVAWLLHREQTNINVRAALLHVLGDALGSLAAIVAGAAIVWWGFMWADGLASLVIAVLVAFAGVRLLRECVHVLMQGTPLDCNLEALAKTITETEGVEGIHDLHVWAVTPGKPILTAHIDIASGYHGTYVVRLVGQRIRAEHGIDHVTIQPEASDPVVPLRLERDASSSSKP